MTQTMPIQPLKTRLLHKIRRVFLLPELEAWLARKTKGRSMSSLIYRLVPHSYTYPRPSYRYFEEASMRFKVDISDFLGHGLYYGYDNQERQSYDRLFSLVKPGFKCIDVGANIGYVSLMMAAQADQVTVIGFEPDPVNFGRAQENLSLNNKIDKVKIHNIGMGEKAGEAVIEVRTRFNLGGNRIARPGSPGEKVLISTLDIFFKGHTEAIDLVKIDVEGYELKVLYGAKELLNQFHPLLFVEINDSNLRYQQSTAAELISFLSQVGYRTFWNTSNNSPISSDMDFVGLHFDLLATP